jgi:signal recognition particle receptor subunit beta
MLGDIRGFKTKFGLFRSPSDGSLIPWVFDEAEQQTVDGIVFVVDSSPAAAASNVASLHALVETLRLRGFDARKLPMVVQYNKRDVPGALAIDQLRASVNPWNHQESEAIATEGIGVFESLKIVAKLVLTEIRNASG